ncbi:hypothetical protein OR1_01684 [Geobacter sp. OR-1]|uniref:hypothetical protein n=1 Tax=Geobacter sp. OR-1 TaxID=1266765 RepID=UPI00054441CB|nr:hypothetical protein [Geobacter sp. OR-1]GAM09406.1 hypothetical protein OR1_01684 [Geobacter sp. OR-1]
MAKTWDNVQCRFQTQNTVNKRGNSEYRVWSNRILRCAPINMDRVGAQDQVYNFMLKAICYLVPNSSLYNLIMDTRDDDRIKIDSVVHDYIYINVDGTVLPASRKPAEGLITFDAVNENGDLSHIHVGHAVYNLKLL